jgi:hypothetical protein
MSKPRQEERDDALPNDKGVANEADLHPSDRALMGVGASDENRDPEDREADGLAADDALYQDVGTQPRSEVTGVEPDNDDQETLDGLDALEESVREQGEDRPIDGRREFEP